jgi:hypothetical protein
LPSDAISLPIYRNGEVAAHTLVDWDDAGLLVAWKWGLSSNGRTVYRRLWLGNGKRRTIFLHREIMGLGPAEFVDGQRIEVDHINRKTLDNRRCNLRICTGAENSQNVPARGGTSQYRGVAWCPAANKWQANVYHDGRLRYLGVYADEEEAAAVASAFRAKHKPFSEDAALAAGGVIHA